MVNRYREAFSRNLGWITEREQQLRKAALACTVQPSYSAVAFARYGWCPDNLPMNDRKLAPRCHALARRIECAWGTNPGRIVCTGRIGIPKDTAIRSRSLRKPLTSLVA